MPDSQKSKSLPKRTGKRHDRKVKAHARGQARKALRMEAQRKRERANKQLRALGKLTPWAAAKAARRKKRAIEHEARTGRS